MEHPDLKNSSDAIESLDVELRVKSEHLLPNIR